MMLPLGFEISQYERRKITYLKRDWTLRQVPAILTRFCRREVFWCSYVSRIGNLTTRTIQITIIPHKGNFWVWQCSWFLPASVFFRSVIFLINVRFSSITANLAWKRFVANCVSIALWVAIQHGHFAITFYANFKWIWNFKTAGIKNLTEKNKRLFFSNARTKLKLKCMYIVCLCMLGKHGDTTHMVSKVQAWS